MNRNLSTKKKRWGGKPSSEWERRDANRGERPQDVVIVVVVVAVAVVVVVVVAISQILSRGFNQR